MLDSPILFIAFNRPEYTLKVFESIKRANPVRLYICIDGPRPNKESDLAACEGVKKIVTDISGIEGEVFYLFRETNLGCKLSVSGAITWFFSQEEMGIILEDDCLPNDSFFEFTEKMLNYYKDDTRIGIVSGTNFFQEKNQNDFDSYFFSSNINIWGWGSWRRVWDKYDGNLQSWRNSVTTKQLRHVMPVFLLRQYYKLIFDKIKKNEIDTWDYQLFYLCVVNSMLSVIPKVNLISNIGIDGTHSAGVSKAQLMESFSMTKELTHPVIVTPNLKYDLFFFEERLYWKSIIELAKNGGRNIAGRKFFNVLKNQKNKFLTKK